MKKLLLMMGLLSGFVANVHCTATTRKVTIYFDKGLETALMTPRIDGKAISSSLVPKKATGRSKWYVFFDAPASTGTLTLSVGAAPYTHGSGSYELPQGGNVTLFLQNNLELVMCTSRYCITK